MKKVTKFVLRYIASLRILLYKLKLVFTKSNMSIQMPDEQNYNKEQTNQDAYDLIADEYSRANLDSNIGDLLETIPTITSETQILDLGCGPGNNIRLFVQFSPRLVVGVDLSKGMLEKARENIGEVQGVKLVRSSFNEYTPEEIFDLVVANLSFVHVEPNELPRVLEMVKSGMAQSGLFFANYFQGEDETKLMESKWGKKKGVRRHFSFHSEEFLRRVYEDAGLEIVSLNKVQPSPNALVRINILAKKK